MIVLTFLLSWASFAYSGVIHHDIEGHGEHGKATSYQSFHMEHFHAVPTYVKKEYKHLLEHPIPAGHSSAKVEVHHGDKHDHGYALVDTKNDAHGSGLGEEIEGHGQASFENAVSHESSAPSSGYQVHDQENLHHLQLQALALGTTKGLTEEHSGGALQYDGYDGSGHYHAAAAPEGNHGYPIALANALHLQHGLPGHS